MLPFVSDVYGLNVSDIVDRAKQAIVAKAKM